MHFDGEVRSVEVGLHDGVGGLQIGRQLRPVRRLDLRTCSKTEPPGPRRRQLRHQTRGKLIHGIRRGPVENPVPPSGPARTAADGGIARRQGIVVTFLPQALPGTAAVLGALVSRDDLVFG